MGNFFKEIFTSKDDIPQEINDRMRFGFVIKYADNIVTGWCGTFVNAETSYMNRGMSSSADTTGIKLKDVILDLGDTISYHSFITVIGVPIILFPNEETIEKKKKEKEAPYLDKQPT
jgi:hypothetical protein